MTILALVLALVPSAPIQAAPAPQDSRPAVAQMLKDLDALLDKHGKEDAKAIESLKVLCEEFASSGPKDRDAIAKSVGRALRDPRPRPDKKSHEDRLAMAAAKALGGMGDAGAKELVPSLTLKHFRVNGPLTETATAELGRTRAKIAVEPLLEMAGIRSEFCVRGAAVGMAHFADADGATRKKLFEGLLKPMNSLADEVRSGAAAETLEAKAIFEGAQAASYEAFRALSGGEAADIDAWRAWWNNHKNASWDKKA